MKSLVIILVVFLLISSCGKEERVIDSTVDDWKLLIATKEANPKLKLFKMPEGEVVSEDVYFDNNNEILRNEITKIKDGFGEIYLIIPSEFKIITIDKSTFVKVAEYNFSAEGFRPVDLCIMSNGTHAYVAHGNTNHYSLIDIKNHAIARHDTLSGVPVSIACIGNLVFTANQQENMLSVIDSREYGEKYTINTPDAPTFIDFSNEGNDLVLVSLGSGKTDTTQEKSKAMVSFYNVLTGKLISERDLNVGSVNSLLETPIGLLTTYNYWAFIPIGDVLLRLDLRRRQAIAIVSRYYYNDIKYNSKMQDLILIRNEDGSTTIISSSQESGVEVSSITIPGEITAFLSL